MIKRKVVLPLLMLLIGATSLVAQKEDKGERGEKIKALREAYMVENLELTDSEAKKFLPIFNAHSEKMRANKKAIREIKKGLKNSENTSETEFTDAMDKISDMRIEEIKSNKQFLNDVLPILGVDRTIKLSELERKFKKQMREKRKAQKAQKQRK